MYQKSLGGNTKSTTFIFTEDNGLCCGDTSTPCETQVVIDPFVTIIGATIDDNGVQTYVPFASPATSDIQVRRELDKVLVSLGFVEDSAKPYGIASVVDGATVTFKLFGAAKLASLRTVGNVDVLVSKTLCEKTANCDFKIAYAGSNTGSVFTVNAVNYTLPALVYGVNTAADVKAAILMATNLPANAGVTVVDDTANLLWQVSITTEIGTIISFDGASAAQCNCGVGFK